MARNGSSGDDSREGSRSSSRNNSLGQGPQDSGSGGRRGTRVRMTSAQISTALREAQQFQQEGRLDSSIQICEELEESGVERPDVYYFLGWLYQEAGRWQDAAAQFERLLDDPEYALSCYYALGQCARALDNIQDAAHYFDEAVDRVNLDILTVEESDQLIQLCQEAAEAHRDMNDIEGAQTIYSALLGFLRSQNWQEQVAEVERLKRETLGDSPPPKRRRATTGGPGRGPGDNIPQRGAGRGRGRAADAIAAATADADGSGAGLANPVGQGAPNGAAFNGLSQGLMMNGNQGQGMGMSPDGSSGGAPLMPPMAPLPTMPMNPQMGAPGYSQYGDPLAAMTPGMAGIEAYPTMAPQMQPGNGYGPYGQGMGSPGAPQPIIGGGMATLVGGASSAPLPGAPGASNDRLAQLINNLSGPAVGMRAGLANLPDPLRTQVAQAVREIENYVAHGLLTAAVEECLRVMEIAPQYLDVHLLLGEIYVRQGKIEQAIAKYAILVDTYLVNGRLDDAIATYRRILQLEPNNLNYRIKLIDLLQKQGRTEEALTERMAAADSYLRMGYADRAIQEYEQALLAHPNSVQVRLNYAAALMKGGRAAQAVGEYQRILQVDPGNTLALARWQIALATGVGTTLGSSTPGANTAAASRVAALETLGRLIRAMRAENFRNFEEIVREYTQALEMNSGSAELRYSLGQVYLAATRQQEALTCFQQMATAPGWEVFARFGAGQAYLLTGDPANAALAARELEEASAAVRRSPPEPTLWTARPRGESEERLGPEVEVGSLLARAYQLSGQVAQMQATMQAISQQRPNDEIYQLMAEVSARQSDPQAQLQEYAQLARQYRSNRQIENAVAILKEMERLAPDDPAVRNELAETQISRGMLDEGLAELRALADIHMRRGRLRDAALVYQRMAEINWGIEKRDEALNELRQAIQYATDEMSLRHQFVQYCLEIGRNADATEQQTVIARYYFSSRQTKEAVAALQQLIAMDKHNFEAYDLLGQTYYSVGEYDQAARVYRNLAKVDPNNAMARARLQELQAVRSQGS